MKHNKQETRNSQPAHKGGWASSQGQSNLQTTQQLRASQTSAETDFRAELDRIKERKSHGLLARFIGQSIHIEPNLLKEACAELGKLSPQTLTGLLKRSAEETWKFTSTAQRHMIDAFLALPDSRAREAAKNDMQKSLARILGEPLSLETKDHYLQALSAIHIRTKEKQRAASLRRYVLPRTLRSGRG